MTRKKRIYIAGMVSALPYEVAYDNFAQAEMKMRAQGKTINPMHLCGEHWGWFRCMLVCVWNLVWKCDRVYLLDNWNQSPGARIEVWFAVLTRKEIIVGD